MTNWESEFFIGDRVDVQGFRLRLLPGKIGVPREPRPDEAPLHETTHRYGTIESLDFEGDAILIQFDDGERGVYRPNVVTKVGESDL